LRDFAANSSNSHQATTHKVPTNGAAMNDRCDNKKAISNIVTQGNQND
jgi:hypothetical protein